MKPSTIILTSLFAFLLCGEASAQGNGNCADVDCLDTFYQIQIARSTLEQDDETEKALNGAMAENMNMCVFYSLSLYNDPKVQLDISSFTSGWATATADGQRVMQYPTPEEITFKQSFKARKEAATAAWKAGTAVGRQKKQVNDASLNADKAKMEQMKVDWQATKQVQGTAVKSQVQSNEGTQKTGYNFGKHRERQLRGKVDQLERDLGMHRQLGGMNCGVNYRDCLRILSSSYSCTVLCGFSIGGRRRLEEGHELFGDEIEVPDRRLDAKIDKDVMDTIETNCCAGLKKMLDGTTFATTGDDIECAVVEFQVPRE